jgi:DNA polymerase I-like protein with 3'-5' exonuclease and polymerase domains/5'-3' exonuclease
MEKYLLPATKLVPLNKIIAVEDAGNLYRKTLSDDYKAKRLPMDPDVKIAVDASMSAIIELLNCLGIVQASVEGTEADDLICYLNDKLPGRKLIFSVDGDLTAMISPTTTVFLKNEPQTAYRKGDLTILPRHVTLFKSIVGDTSDGITGIKGMGPSAWSTLVTEFGIDGIDELVAIVDSDDLGQLKTIAEQAKHPLLNKIVLNINEWRKSYLLAKLRPELVDGKQGGKFTRIKWNKRLPEQSRLDRLMKSTSAYWLAQDLKHLMPTQTLITAKDWDDDVLKEATQLFKGSRYISIDWETWAPEHAPFTKASKGTYVDMLSSKITGTGFTCGENLEHTFYFQFDHADEDNNIDKSHLVELLDCIPEGMPIIAQNALFERTVFLNEFGFDIPGLHDTKIMASHVDESLPSGLKDMTKHWMNYSQLRYDDVIAKGKTMKDYTGEHVFKYGADDPLVTAHLYDLFYIILNLEGTWEFVRDNEFTMNYVLSDGYLDGVAIDFDEVERQREEDQLTYDTNLLTIRGLLKANLDKDTIYAGAKNWMEELLVNHRAEAKYLSGLIAKASKSENFIAVLRANKIVMKWVGDSVTDEATLEQILDKLNEKLFRDSIEGEAKSGTRAPLWKQAVEAATYADYKEEPKPASFSWSLGKVNQLSEIFGLPVWPSISDLDAMNAYQKSIEHILMWEDRGDKENFVEAVFFAAEAAVKKKHTKTESYKWLKEQYVSRFEGGIEKSGSELNLNSPKQAAELLYAMLGLPIRTRAMEISNSRVEKGLEGSPQTNKDALAMAIASGDAVGWKRKVLELLTEAKSASTRIGLFYSKLPMWKHPIDGLIHPQFNSCGTETRRFSGSSPNMLQLSKRGEGVKVRQCFIPNTKYDHDVIVSIDFDGQELRIIAGLSGDKAMTSCYVGDNKKNVHSLTGAGIAGTSYEEFIAILKDEDHQLSGKFGDIRKDSKNVNFLSAYGGGAGKLARKLLCSVEIAKEYLTAKKNVYFGIEEWRAQQIAILRDKGFFKTLFGSRKHVFNKVLSSDDGMNSYYERASINFQIQGVAADYLKKVLTDMYKARTLKRHGAVMYAAIYDEMVFSVHSSQAVDFIKEVYSFMVQGIPGLPIETLANPSIGLNFADQIEILKDADDPLTDAKIMKAMNKAFGIEEQMAA